MIIDESTNLTEADLEALRRDLEIDRAAIEKRAEFINGEQNRRDFEPTRLVFESMKAIRAEKCVAHGELVKQCRTAKDELTKQDARLAKLQRPSSDASSELARSQFALGSHSRPSADSYPLPEELDAWKTYHATLEGNLAAAQKRLAESTERVRVAQSERDTAANALRELAGQERTLREELHL